MSTWYRLVGCVVAGACATVGWATNASSQVGTVNGAPAVADESLRQASAGAEAARRLDLAESILSQREAEAGRPLDARYRGFLKADLAELSESRLEALLGAGSVVNLREGLIPNVLGDTSADLVYTPVTPCRVFDTRTSAAGILVGGTQQNFFVAGATGFPAQGGHSGGCGIPFGTATSVIINFAAVTPTGSGNLRAWAVATPQPAAPTAAVMNFSTAMAALANGVAVPICDPAATTCPSDLRLQADVSSVHVVGDVLGYFGRASSPRTTQIVYGGQTNAAPPGLVAPVTFRTLGTFTKAVAASAIVVTWHGHVEQTGTPGTTFCQYQVRVDDTTPSGTVNEQGLGVVDYGDSSSATLTGRWTGLATGSHTISLWLRGTATTCTVNRGSFSNQQVYVVEQ